MFKAFGSETPPAPQEPEDGFLCCQSSVGKGGLSLSLTGQGVLRSHFTLLNSEVHGASSLSAGKWQTHKKVLGLNTRRNFTIL